MNGRVKEKKLEMFYITEKIFLKLDEQTFVVYPLILGKHSHTHLKIKLYKEKFKRF